MTTSAPSEASSRGRFTAAGAASIVLLALPFIVFGVAVLDMKARVEIQCEAMGPCTVTRAGWLSKEEVGRYTLEEMRGSKVERNRKSRNSDESVWRPVLETTRGDVPLSYAWMPDERKAQYAANVVLRYLNAPFRGLTLWHDDRAGAGRLGTGFIVVGVLLLGMSAWVFLKARRMLREESRAATPATEVSAG
ncbi:hypothetical protein P2318_00270 [Myxococcaceae bacterium GXIMD 01537]